MCISIVTQPNTLIWAPAGRICVVTSDLLLDDYLLLTSDLAGVQRRLGRVGEGHYSAPSAAWSFRIGLACSWASLMRAICAWVPPLSGWWAWASLAQAWRILPASALGGTPSVSCQLNWTSSSKIWMASGELPCMRIARAAAQDGGTATAPVVDLAGGGAGGRLAEPARASRAARPRLVRPRSCGSTAGGMGCASVRLV